MADVKDERSSLLDQGKQWAETVKAKITTSGEKVRRALNTDNFQSPDSSPNSIKTGNPSVAQRLAGYSGLPMNSIQTPAGIEEVDRGSQLGSFRHTYWQALQSRDSGVGLTAIMGNLNEVNEKIRDGKLPDRFSPPEEVNFSDEQLKPMRFTLENVNEIIDQRNNQIGQRLASDFSKEKPPTNKEVALAVLDDFKKNGIYEAKQDGNLDNYQIVRTPLTDEQYKAIKSNLMVLDNNAYHPIIDHQRFDKNNMGMKGSPVFDDVLTASKTSSEQASKSLENTLLTKPGYADQFGVAVQQGLVAKGVGVNTASMLTQEKYSREDSPLKPGSFEAATFEAMKLNGEMGRTEAQKFFADSANKNASDKDFAAHMLKKSHEEGIYAVAAPDNQGNCSVSKQKLSDKEFQESSSKLDANQKPTTPQTPVDHMAMWDKTLQNPAHQAGVASNQQGRAL